jgi:serine phosphatase RsbU (regulator of sigma subunit)
MIIGMFPAATYEEAAVDVKPGDVLLAFTDGVTEALNLNEEEFGEQRLKTLLCEVGALPLSRSNPASRRSFIPGSAMLRSMMTSRSL